MIKLNKEAEKRHQKQLSLQQEQQLLKAQIAYTRSQNQKITKGLGQKNQKIQELQKKYSQISIKSSNLKQKETIAKATYNQIVEQRKELTIKLENLNIAKSKLHQQLQNLKIRSITSSQQLQKLKIRMSKKDKQYEQAEQATIELKEKIQRAKQKISEIQRQIALIDGEISALGIFLEGGI